MASALILRKETQKDFFRVIDSGPFKVVKFFSGFAAKGTDVSKVTQQSSGKSLKMISGSQLAVLLFTSLVTYLPISFLSF